MKYEELLAAAASLEKDSLQPLYLQLEELIRGWIATGQLRPGDRIPSEPELADKLGMSRMTARRAIDELVADGTCLRRPGKGTFVAKDKVVYTPSTFFSFSTYMTSMGYTVTTKVLEMKKMRVPESEAATLRLSHNDQVILLKRLRFVDGQPMAMHTSYLPAGLFPNLMGQDLTAKRLTDVMEEISGLRITSTNDSVEAALVNADEAALLKVPKSSPVLLVRGVAYTEDGTPVRSTKAVYRGDRFRFNMRDGLLLKN